MAIRVDIDRDRLTACIDLQIASLKRAITTAKNPQFKPLLEKDISDLTVARNTISEVK